MAEAGERSWPVEGEGGGERKGGRREGRMEGEGGREEAERGN
jgi:hypothetical protein